MKKALLLIDIQNDFLPKGALPVKHGNRILPVINQILRMHFDQVAATKDWHPANHGSFAKNQNREPGEVINLQGVQQILWPEHCVQGTPGAEFAPDWDSHKVDRIFYKGTDKDIDSYSAFFDNAGRRSTGLAEHLKQNEIEAVYIAGLATDYCVKYSALDSCRLGFKTFVLKDACEGIELQQGDIERAYREMEAAGARIIDSKQLASSHKR